MHTNHTICNRCKRPIVSNNDNGSSFIASLILENLQDLFSSIVIQGSCRFVTEEYFRIFCDGGPILLQKAVDILPGDTPEVLQKRVMEQAEWKLLPKAVAMVCSGEIK